MEIQDSIKINASISDVFDYLNDIRNRTDFATDLDDFKLLSHQFKGLGTRYIERTKLMGMSIKNHFEVTKCLSNQLIEIKTIVGPIATQHHIQLDALSAITKITWSQNIDFTGAYRTIRPFVMTKMISRLSNDLKNLEQQLDTSPSLITMITAPNTKFWI